MNVSEKIIRTSIDEGQINALAFFYFCKSKWVSSVFLNYTPKRLALATGLSVNSVKKYVAWLSKQKIGHYIRSTYRTADPLIFIHNGNLHFSRVQPQHHITKFNSKNKSLKEIRYLLYGILIQANITAQKYSIKTKKKDKIILKNPCKDIKRYKKIVRDPRAIVIGDRLSLGYRKICRELKIGVAKVQTVANYLEQQKILTRIKVKSFFAEEKGKILYRNPKFDEFDRADLWAIKDKYPFARVTFCNGGILVCPATKWCFKEDRNYV